MKEQILFGLFLSCFFSFVLYEVSAGRAACSNPSFRHCYGTPHTCPPGCPKLCEVDCYQCKPYCACDKPGSVCQDPRFIGGDGIMFYFHGKKDQAFCLVSDPKVHINGRFIGKRSRKGRDFTWVQSIGVLFRSQQLHIGAKKVAEWDESDDNILITMNREHVKVPNGESQTWRSNKTGLMILREAETNKVRVRVEGLFEIAARVAPISEEESKVHGYDIKKDDCFAHLELNFKFHSLSKEVDGVLGQTYRPGYQSKVKMAAPMPLMGGEHRSLIGYQSKVKIAAPMPLMGGEHKSLISYICYRLCGFNLRTKARQLRQSQLFKIIITCSC